MSAPKNAAAPVPAKDEGDEQILELDGEVEAQDTPRAIDWGAVHSCAMACGQAAEGRYCPWECLRIDGQR